MKNKRNLDKDLVHTIDQLIIDTACYQPVELLLRLNLLAYADYEQWCMGKTNYLSDSLNHNKKEIIHNLDEALFYVQSLNLLPEPMIMHQWQQAETTQILPFCPDDSPFYKYLDNQYVRQDDDTQMDLFFDNQSLSIVKELKQALISRNVKIASQQFQALYQTDPEHEFFQPAKILLDALIDALEGESITDTVKEMYFLLDELKPLSKKVLAGQERDYMSLFWRRLAKHINNSHYSEDKEAMHSSFCYQQIPDWQAVIDSIKTTPDANKQPELFTRLAIAFNKSGQYKKYIQMVCQYYWQSPQQESKKLISSDTSLKNIWYDFLDQEMDEQWGTQHFPAWLLIKSPGISHYIVTNKETPEEFLLLQQLIQTEKKENTQAIALRKKLKNTHSGMLQLYLKLSAD